MLLVGNNFFNLKIPKEMKGGQQSGTPNVHGSPLETEC